MSQVTGSQSGMLPVPRDRPRICLCQRLPIIDLSFCARLNSHNVIIILGAQQVRLYPLGSQSLDSVTPLRGTRIKQTS